VRAENHRRMLLRDCLTHDFLLSSWCRSNVVERSCMGVVAGR
jgi:hypothetical protein